MFKCLIDHQSSNWFSIGRNQRNLYLAQTKKKVPMTNEKFPEKCISFGYGYVNISWNWSKYELFPNWNIERKEGKACIRALKKNPQQHSHVWYKRSMFIFIRLISLQLQPILSKQSRLLLRIPFLSSHYDCFNTFACWLIFIATNTPL